MDSTSIINVITQTINTLFKNLFSSIDNNIYATLDDITFIGSDILNDNFIIIVETDEPDRILDDIKNIDIDVYDTRKYGRVSLLFLRHK